MDSPGYLHTQGDDTVAKAAQAQTDDLMRGVWLTGGGGLIGVLIGCFISLATLRSLRAKLIAAVQELATATGEIRQASEEVAIASRSLANGASEQAASIEETSASCEEINSMARRSSELAQSMAATMADSEGSSTVGLQDVERMVEAMNEIHSSSEKVSKIIKIIDEIAFQTNFLALTQQ